MIVLHRVREVRLERGLSQFQLGELLNMEAATVSRLERKIRNPKLTTLQAVAAALKCTVDELVNQETG